MLDIKTLETWLWDAACSIRGSVDAPKYKDYILPLAQENGQQDKHKELCAFDKQASPIIAQSQIEQWAINANVHFNKWADMGKNDFKPVKNAFKDLFGLFACKGCGHPMELVYHKDGNEVVSCGCGKIFWNV